MSEAVLHTAPPMEPQRLDDELPSECHRPIDAVRTRRVVQEHHAFVWRSLRRLGVIESDVDDAVQKVFLTATRRLGDVPVERERAYLFATCVRIAANERRAQSRKRHMGMDDLDAYRGTEPSPEQTTADRALLDKLLDPLPLQLRSVFILFELEQMTKQEIAVVMELPEGTVASRLRRARELVEAAIARLRASHQRGVT